MITDGQLYVRCDGCGSFVNSSESQAHQCPPQQQHPAIGGRTELTNRETERLDFVHNTIHQAICDLAGQELEWDAETIGAISDLVEELVCNRLNIMPDYEFAPYIESPVQKEE